MKLTGSSAKVLIEFLGNPSRDQYGFGLMKATGLQSGSLYPILDRLEQVGWVEVYDEPIDERREGRPRRRMYRLNAHGRAEARRAVVEFFGDLPQAPNWVPHPRGA